jgi:hypothetical protein
LLKLQYNNDDDNNNIIIIISKGKVDPRTSHARPRGGRIGTALVLI